MARRRIRLGVILPSQFRTGLLDWRAGVVTETSVGGERGYVVTVFPRHLVPLERESTVITEKNLEEGEPRLLFFRDPRVLDPFLP